MGSSDVERRPARMQRIHWLLIALIENLVLIGLLAHLTHMHFNYGIRQRSPRHRRARGKCRTQPPRREFDSL